MKKMTVNLLARTPVHVGAGNSVGTVDSPVQRERHTRIPLIPGSTLKGVLSDLWNDENFKRNEEGKELFGEEDNKLKAPKAGRLFIGEGRILAFPVRSAKGMFAWLSSPLVLSRFKRDIGLDFTIPELNAEEVLASDTISLDGRVILEEYPFTINSPVSQDIIDVLKNLIPGDSVWDQVDSKLVIVSDEIFQHFCENACEIVTRIAVDNEKGTARDGALFNMEQVPSETLFYSVVLSQCMEKLEQFKTKINEQKFLQIGGDASIGLGFCSVNTGEIQ